MPRPPEPFLPAVVGRVRHNSYKVKKPGDADIRYHRLPQFRLVNLLPRAGQPTLHDRHRLKWHCSWTWPPAPTGIREARNGQTTSTSRDKVVPYTFLDSVPVEGHRHRLLDRQYVAWAREKAETSRYDPCRQARYRPRQAGGGLIPVPEPTWASAQNDGCPESVGAVPASAATSGSAVIATTAPASAAAERAASARKVARTGVSGH